MSNTLECVTCRKSLFVLAEKGIEIVEPADIIRDPYVFEFLGLPEDKPVVESDLERALVQQIEKFLLELGRGFIIVGTQQRVTVNNTHYYSASVDLRSHNSSLPPGPDGSQGDFLHCCPYFYCFPRLR